MKTTIAAKLLAAIALVSCTQHTLPPRTEQMITQWEFCYTPDTTFGIITRDTIISNQQWHNVIVPHDWAIAAPFDKDIDKQIVAIEQNGETEATEHTGRTGSLPYIGSGWYKTSFRTNATYERTLISFDGVMSQPRVYVNGEYVGGWEYGYTPFIIDITKNIKHNSDNTLEVFCRNIPESARWYPGAGIYRPVTLIQTHATAISEWGISVCTNNIALDSTKATANIATHIIGDTTNVKIAFSVEEKDTHTTPIYTIDNNTLTITNPKLWSPETPHLYTLICTLTKDNNIIDQKQTTFGIRTVSCTPQQGFQLNGQTRKIKGVCLHHDLGMLGTALNKTALRRQIALLKDMGCDAIRTAHNIPSVWQMEICDSMGMMVMAESFDEWIYPKCKNGYHRYFSTTTDNGQTWAERDLTALIECHKNHPSIIMWSIGNEIPEQGDKEHGAYYVRHFTDLIHSLDPDKGRLVTSGCDRIDAAIWSGFAQQLDIVGMNYRTHKYQYAYDNTPQKMILGSETASTVSSRGVYKLPVVRADNKEYPDGQCSSYDQEACWWSNIPENDCELQDDKPWVIGEFVWTGFDYFGEPTPYDGYWPARSSYFGILDLAGLPKDRYFLYRSRWNTNENTIHILPHWTWPGHEGDTIPVYCYTNYNEAELFVNNKSQGRITKNKDKLSDRYRLRWNNVIYEPGEIAVVAYDDKGKPHTVKMHTAGQAHHLQLNTDRTTICADNTDIAFITITMKDAEDNVCPNATDKLTFEVSGDGHFRGACNGDPTSLEPLTQPQMSLFNGQMVLAIQSNGKKGNITLTIHSSNTPDATINIAVE